MIRLGNSSVTLVATSADLRVGDGTTIGCVADGNGTIIAGTCQSDERFKKDIRPFELLLHKVTGLEPVYFRWKTDEYPQRMLGPGESFGLLAQQVEKVFPEMVTEDPQGYKAVKYSMLPLMLLQAVKEQQGMIERHERESSDKDARIAALEKEASELRARQAFFEAIAARLEALQLRLDRPVQAQAASRPAPWRPADMSR